VVGRILLHPSESDPANFTVKGFSMGTTCTATETVPVGYAADQKDCLNVDLVSDGVCTITNTFALTPTPTPIPNFPGPNTRGPRRELVWGLV